MNCSTALWSKLDLAGCPSVINAGLTEPTLVGQVARLLDELPPRFALAGLSLGSVDNPKVVPASAVCHPGHKPQRWREV